jgi:uncharacterized protein
VQENFYRFRSRYIILDIALVFMAHAVLFIVAEAVTGISSAVLIKDRIVINLFEITFMVTLCLAISRRFKKPNIKLKYIIGSTSINSIKTLPWLMLLIAFYGIYTLSQGIASLTIYFTHLFAPIWAKSAVEEVGHSISYAYNTDSLALNLLFWITLFVSLAIIPPLIEAFLFRGVLLHRFGAKWGTVMAVLLSSFCFGIAHANIHGVAIGISFIFVSLLYIKTKALIVPIAFHVMNNTIAFVSGTIESSAHLNRPINIGMDDLWSGIINVAFAIPILLYFFKWPNSLDLLPYQANLERR